MKTRTTLQPALLAAMLVGTLHALTGVNVAQGQVTYASHVAPIFAEKCVACHSHANRSSGLNLESYEALMNGGKRGAAVVAGRSAESLLVKYVDGTLKPRMPLGDKLSDAEVGAIKAWIDAGAAGPASADAASHPPAAEMTKAAKPNVPDIKPAVAVRSAASSLAFSPDGQKLALGGYKEVELLGAAMRGGAKLGGLASQVRALAFSPDGRLLAAAGGNPSQFGEVKIFSVTDGKEVAAIRGHRDNIFAVAFAPDGKTVATCSYDRMVKLWDAATGKEVKNLKDHTDAVFSVAFSPDGRRLASASADRTVKIWDAGSGQRLYTLSDALGALNTVAFHPSGKYVAAAGADRVIRVWEAGEKEGKQVRSLISHEDAINQIIYSPDGKLIASTGADKVIKLWQADTLAEVRVFERQPDWVFAMAFSPEGNSLVVGRYDGSVTSYDVATGKGSRVR
jgi:uncharacterized protein with WD repeat/mono/diheme cytochrome c family protein